MHQVEWSLFNKRPGQTKKHVEGDGNLNPKNYHDVKAKKLCVTHEECLSCEVDGFTYGYNVQCTTLL